MLPLDERFRKSLEKVYAAWRESLAAAFARGIKAGTVRKNAADYGAEQDREGKAIVKAICETGVRYVVALSSVGADLSEGTGVIAGLHAQEEGLKKIEGINLLLLWPVSFFENFFDSLSLIKQEGINSYSVQADLPIPMVATRDIANAASTALKSRDWNGVVVRELLGPRDLS